MIICFSHVHLFISHVHIQYKNYDLNVIIDMTNEYGKLKFHRKLTELKLYKN